MQNTPGTKIRADIENSKKHETAVADHLANYFGCVVKPTYGESARYDGRLLFTDDDYHIKELLYEVKDERKFSRKTGNHFVELKSRAKLSGLMTTHSDYWVVQPDDKVILVIPTSELLFGIYQHAGSWKEVLGGDYVNGEKSSLGVLVPLSWIEGHDSSIIINIS